ncbi:hypothetical protein PMI09_00922 [Rhizobium sp. CF122]|nr:hypothetical protein PMI09_00922 [Rhizobium sp. CF122]
MSRTNPPAASLLAVGPWSNFPSAQPLPKLALSFRQKRTRRGTFGPLRGLERSPTGRLTSRLSSSRATLDCGDRALLHLEVVLGLSERFCM